jgi:hypothetical protein
LRERLRFGASRFHVAGAALALAASLTEIARRAAAGRKLHQDAAVEDAGIAEEWDKLQPLRRTTFEKCCGTSSVMRCLPA